MNRTGLRMRVAFGPTPVTAAAVLYLLDARMVDTTYLGRVQHVLPSMEAAFIDIGQGRTGVLYAGEVDWRPRPPRPAARQSTSPA